MGLLSKSRNLDLLFTGLLAFMLILGTGIWIGYSFTGTTNTFAPGSFETTDVNITGDWYRGSTNLTARLLGTWGALISTSLDTGQGAYELYGMDQNVLTTSSPTFNALTVATLDTGYGANDLFDMDQHVLTTSDPTFDEVTVTTLDTGQGANELYDMDQNVLTTSDPTFNDLTIDEIYMTGFGNYTAWIESRIQSDYDYVIHKIGASYYSFNSSGVNASSSSFHSVVNWAIGNITTRGSVYVAGGTYSVTGAITVTDNIMLKGAGSSTYLELDYDGVAIQTSDGCDDFYIGGFRIDGNRAARGAGTGLNITGGYRGTVENIYFHDLDDYGIYTGDDSTTAHTRQSHYMNIRMINAGITGAGWYNEYIMDSKISNVEIGFSVDAAYCWRQIDGGSGVMASNFHLWADGAGTTTGLRTETDSFRSQFVNLYGGGANMDHLISCAGHSFLFDGVIVEDCSDTQIEIVGANNAVYDIRSSGADAAAVVWTGQYGVLAGGQILDATGDGITWSHSYGMISDIVINNPGDEGLEATSNFITASGLTVFSAGDNGVYATGDYFVLTSSTIGYSTDYGVLFSGVTGGVVSSSHVFESVNQDGVGLDGSPWCSVTGNTIHDNDAANMRGIDLTGVSANCSVTGNSIWANGDYNLHMAADADDGVYDGNVWSSYGMTDNVLDQSGGTWTTGDNEAA